MTFFPARGRVKGNGRDRFMSTPPRTPNTPADEDHIPDTPLFDRKRTLAGYPLNKAMMGLGDPANRAAFKADEGAYLDRHSLSPAQKQAVMTRNWREMVRLGGNLFFILKISAIYPVRMTEIGAHQAGMEHGAFLRERLGKKV